MTSQRVVVGVDISETEGNMTGVGRYTMDLLKVWLDPAQSEASTAGDASEFVLFARDRSRVPSMLRETARVVASTDSATSERGVVGWQQLALPGLLRKNPVDLLFCPAYAIPLLSNTPAVVALHDLSFERDPGAFGRKEAFRRRFLARRSARKAVGVVTISDFSRSEIEKLYQVDPERILMAYPSCDRSAFKPSESDLNKGANPTRPYFLSVGTLLERRHIDVLIQSFAALGPDYQDHELVIVGSNQTRPQIDFLAIAQAAGVGERVRFHGHVSEQQLVELYQSTELLISLSSYEGFGLPVLEAVCCGAPTLVLATPLNKELWAGLLPMVAAAKVASVAEAIRLAAGRPPDQELALAFAENRFDRRLGAAKVLKFLHANA